MIKYIPSSIKYLITIFFLLLLLISTGRIILIFQFNELLPEESFIWALKSIWQGLQFDSTIASYIIAFPYLVLIILFLFNISSKKAMALFGYLFHVFFIVVIIFVMTDLPYFSFYNSRLSKGILSWTDSPSLMMEAIFTENSYYPYIVLGLFLIFFLLWLNTRLVKYYLKSEERFLSPYYRVLIFVIFSFVLFLGIRGDWDFSEKPITTERAFISNNAFVNQMSMNPIFNFFDSFRSIDVQEMSDDEALKEAVAFLNGNEDRNCSPISREVDAVGPENKMNIVLILVESLSAKKVGVCGNEEKLTPVLDSLARNGIFFSNFYSAGVHTHNGIFSSLYGIPSILNKKPMADSYLSSIEYTGLPITLKEQGYQTTFSCTGDLNFDNMGSFLKSHGFDDVFGKNDYKEEDIYNSWGLADHKLFEYVIESIDSKVSAGPVFQTVLTVSSHDGYYPPIIEDFKPKSETKDNHRYEYADWAIGRFLKNASKKEWFKNTLFVILGDHGQNFNPVYELPLSYVQIPMVIYRADSLESKKIENPSMQIDIFPTLMAMLDLTYENNTLGIDLQAEKREFAYFSSDDYIGCINNDYYWLSGVSGYEAMFSWRDKERQNEIVEQKIMGDKMKHHVYSMMQTAQYLMKKDLLGPCKE